jgi:hypothetical protein
MKFYTGRNEDGSDTKYLGAFLTFECALREAYRIEKNTGPGMVFLFVPKWHFSGAGRLPEPSLRLIRRIEIPSIGIMPLAVESTTHQEQKAHCALTKLRKAS